MKNQINKCAIKILPVFLIAMGFFIFTNCDNYRLGPESTPPNQTVPLAQPLVMSGFVRDALNQSPISGASVRILLPDGTFLTTLLSDSNGKYSFDASNVNANTLNVGATKDGYAYAVRIGSIYKAANAAIISDILLTKLQIATATVTVSGGGNASTPNTQSLANQPLQVQVPANAVSSNVQLTAASIPAGQVPQPTTINTFILSVGQFGPSNTQFSQPVTITFPLPYRQSPGTVYNLWQLNEQTGTYTNSGFSAAVNADGTTASAQVTHFSIYTLQTPQGVEVTISLNTPSTRIANEFYEKLTDGSLDKPLSITNTVDLSGDGAANDLWLKDQIASNLKFSIASTGQRLTFSFSKLPDKYKKNINGVETQIGPDNRPGGTDHSGEKGNWEFRSYYVLQTTSITGEATGPGWKRHIEATSQLWLIVSEGWYWVPHDQGGIFFGPY